MPRSLRHCRSPCARLSYPHPHPLPTAPSQRHGYQFTGCVAARVVALRQIRCRAVSLVSPCVATHLCAWQNYVKRANCLLLSKLAQAFKLITWTNWIVRSSSACCSSVFFLFSLFASPFSLFLFLCFRVIIISVLLCFATVSVTCSQKDRPTCTTFVTRHVPQAEPGPSSPPASL